MLGLIFFVGYFRHAKIFILKTEQGFWAIVRLHFWIQLWLLLGSFILMHFVWFIKIFAAEGAKMICLRTPNRIINQQVGIIRELL